MHRLIATLFIPNPDNKPQVDHINGDKSDNRAVNLRWVDALENYHNPNTVSNHITYKDPHRYYSYYKNGKEYTYLKLSRRI